MSQLGRGHVPPRCEQAPLRGTHVGVLPQARAVRVVRLPQGVLRRQQPGRVVHRAEK